MGERKVIKHTNLPTRSPIISTLVFILALDYWNAPEWSWGVLGVLLVILWGNYLYWLFNEEEQDIMAVWKSECKKEVKPKFTDRLKDAIEESKNQ